MAIYRQLRETAFEPAEIGTMTSVYERLLVELDLKHRDDPVTDLLAHKIIELFDPGELNPDTLCKRVREALHLPQQARNH